MDKLIINYEDKDCDKEIKKTILELLGNNENVVIICIGTDRSTGDSLGPLIGTFIHEKISIPVFGTLKETVNAKNVKETIDYIKKVYDNPFIIVIDACVGSNCGNVGNIIVCNEPIKPGSALNKDLPKVGDICILGTVNISSNFDFLVLQNTRLNTVYEMAIRIANGLIEIFK